MAGDNNAAEYRGQLPPFSPPKFNWNQDNLYKQFKSFKHVVEFVFQSQYEKCSNGIKCGSIPHVITCSSVRMTRKTQPSYWMHLNVTLNLRGIFANLSMP